LLKMLFNRRVLVREVPCNHLPFPVRRVVQVDGQEFLHVCRLSRLPLNEANAVGTGSLLIHVRVRITGQVESRGAGPARPGANQGATGTAGASEPGGQVLGGLNRF